ncbi:MAG: DUF1573 domain-containing protein [Acidobacteriota bacterium]
MVRKVFLTIFALILCAGVALSQSSRPKLVLSASEFDLGELYNNEEASYIVKLSNGGARNLRIFGVSTTCGCVGVLLGKATLKPGESSEVQVRIDPDGKSGPFSQGLTLRTNEPNRPFTTVALRGTWIEKPADKEKKDKEKPEKKSDSDKSSTKPPI